MGGGGVCASMPLIGQTAGQYVPRVGSECDEMMRVLFLGEGYNSMHPRVKGLARPLGFGLGAPGMIYTGSYFLVFLLRVYPYQCSMEATVRSDEIWGTLLSTASSGQLYLRSGPSSASLLSISISLSFARLRC